MEWEPTRAMVVNTDRYSTPREPKIGVMLHYDGSTTDVGAVSWFSHPECQVSYQVLVLDDGSYVRIAPDGARAWHAGYCRTSDPQHLPYRDANSALYGLAISTTDGVDVTPLQMLTTAWITRRWFDFHGWDPAETWRVVGHSSEAVFGPGHQKEGQRGRKTDPEGSDPKNPIMSVEDIRQLLPLIRPPNYE